jgi:hypothetical protein
VAEKHPYMSGSAGLVQAVVQLRKSFPSQVAADTLKKLGIAPNNETYVLTDETVKECAYNFSGKWHFHCENN